MPGKTMPSFQIVERDYTAIADKLAAVGPLADKLGFTVKNVTYRLEHQTAQLAASGGVMLGGAADGRPAIDTDAKMAEAILTFSGTTNGELAVQGFRSLEQRTGVHRRPCRGVGGEKDHVRPDQQAPVPVITSPEWSGSETGGRRYALFTVNVERLKPWHTRLAECISFLIMTGCVIWVKRCRPTAPPLDMHRLRRTDPGIGWSQAGDCALPDSALSGRSTPNTRTTCSCCPVPRRTNHLAQPAGRSGIGVADNDWMECVNANGVLVGRAIVSHRMPEGVVYVHHAQERIIDVPKSEATGRRGGIHNSVTRLLVKPTHLIGGYAQLSYTFNYLGPTGNQRDIVSTIRRRSQEVQY